ncbi:MAG: hypothetical protein QM808_07275 [Steroidobacteraceae bacterium]
MSNLTLVRLLIATACLSMGQLGMAQTQRSGSDGARVMQQLQQITAEKSKLQQDNDALKKELEELKAKYTQAGAEQLKLQQRTRDLESAAKRQQQDSIAAAGNDDALQKSRVQLNELVTKFRETTQTLKEVETDRDALRTDNAAKERAVIACIDKNAQMYLLSNEVLESSSNRACGRR